MARIYIAHAPSDEELAHRVRAVLSDHGHRVASRSETLPGEAWQDAVYRQIASADVVLSMGVDSRPMPEIAAFETGIAATLQHQSGRPLIVPLLAEEDRGPVFLRHVRALWLGPLMGAQDEERLLSAISSATERLVPPRPAREPRDVDALLSEFASAQAARIRLRGEEGMPQWALVHFLDSFTTNHMKLVLSQRICEVLTNGFHDEDLEIGTDSAELLPNSWDSERSRELGTRTGSYQKLGLKSENADAFWGLLRRLRRPVVRLRYRDEWYSLYSPYGPEAARVGRLVEESPPIIDLQGAAGALVDLTYASEREERARADWENRQLGQATENIERIVRASQVIESPDTPPGVQAYARQELLHLQERQSKLNRRMGIVPERIDIEA